MHPWIVPGVLLVLIAAVVAAPLLGPAGLPIYAAFSWVCHQRPERCWQLAGHPLAVCVRCLGLYSGALAGALAGLRFSRPLLAASLALLGVDWLAEAAGWLGPRPLSRFVVGSLAGLFLITALRTEPRRARSRIPWLKKEVQV